MTIEQIIGGLESISRNLISTIDFTDRFDNGVPIPREKRDSFNYPLMAVQDQGVTMNETSLIHTLLIMVVMPINNDITKVTEIQSECFSILNDTLLILQRDEAFEDLIVEDGASATPIDKDLPDECAGYQVTVTINVDRQMQCVQLKCD